MSNVTIALQDDLLNQSRVYARKHNTSLNYLIRSLLQKTTNTTARISPINKVLDLSAKIQGNSCGNRWSRNDIYDV